jgi:predicted DNA-binding transcriptional regulator AlpA
MEIEIMNADALASWLGVDRQRIYHLCRTDPEFPVILLGQKQYRFSKTAVQRWLDRGGSKKDHTAGRRD